MHTVVCLWSPRFPQQVQVAHASGPPLSVPVTLFGGVLGDAALARLRLRGSLTLPVFEDEWRALTRQPPLP